jgi:hypothetical protein
MAKLDIVDDIARQAKLRDAHEFAKLRTALSAQNEPLVAAHLGFGFLHAVMAAVADRLVGQGYKVDFYRDGGHRLVLRVNGRSVECRHWLDKPTVEIERGGDMTLEQRVTSFSPESADPADLFPQIEPYIEIFARHLTRSP